VTEFPAPTRARLGRSGRPAGPEGVKRWRGTVKFFNQQKGYGFISREVGDDVFVYCSAIPGSGFTTFREGQRVEFDVGPGENGDGAQPVRPISSPVAVGLAAGRAGLDAGLAARRGR
jgi:cold shock protein